MSEGVDLKGDLSKFQILCKVPFPYLGDAIVKKRMNKRESWYPLQTAKTIVQSVIYFLRYEYADLIANCGRIINAAKAL